MSKRWSRILLLGAAALFVSLSAWAQSSTTGVIEGKVRDQAGTAVADATITGVANRGPSATVTDSQGPAPVWISPWSQGRLKPSL
jgi:hypothetical protein